jgi:hypothetical protein
MQFIFINTKQFELTKYKALSRFGLMHMLATNLCEWLYVIVEEAKHEIIHILNNNELLATNSSNHNMHKRATSLEIVVDCRRTNIMGTLVQNASPFLFPCTIEYSLICAVIVFEMWKKIKSDEKQPGSRKSSKDLVQNKNIHHLSIDCSKAHRGIFSGISIIVLTIISLIMYFVLSSKGQPHLKSMAVIEVSIAEMVLYFLTILAVLAAFYQMRDLKFSKNSNSGIGLDCTLLLLGEYLTSVYIKITSIIQNIF